MGVPSIDQFHRWKGCKRQIYRIAGSRQQLPAEFMAIPRTIIRALVTPCGSSLRRRHWTRLHVSGHPATLSAALLPTPMTPRYGPAVPAPSSAVAENPARLDDDAVAQSAAIPRRAYR